MNKRKMQAVVIVDPRNAIVNGAPSADALYTDNNKGDWKGQDVNGRNINLAQNNTNNNDDNNNNVK